MQVTYPIEKPLLLDTEIDIDPALSKDQETLLDAHSLLNILNIFHGELTIIGLQLCGDEGLFEKSMKRIRAHADTLRDHEAYRKGVAQLEGLRPVVTEDLKAVQVRFPEMTSDKEVVESLANIESIFTVLERRVSEILERIEDPAGWRTYSSVELERQFRDVFAAIEKNSRGRYRIIYNLAQQEASDYYIRMDFSSLDTGELLLPPIFIDVMRDLIANARKYTAPGGKISCGLFEDAKRIRLVVEDTGRGIPPEDIPGVVEFGRRGSNVGNTRTMGGGFGLTKALCVTRRYGGRMWIASRVGVGTRIRIEIPRLAEG